MTFIAACALGLITTGCQTIMPQSEANKLVEIPASKTNHIPEWFFTKQMPDSKGIIVTATDISKDMQFAIDKATLNAKIQLAERLGTKIDSLVQETTIESGVGAKNVTRDVDRVSKARVSQELNFFTRENVFVVKDGDHFRAFVMLRLPNEEGRRLIQKDNKDNKKSREERLKELDNNGDASVKPVSQIDRSTLISNTIKDESVKARIAKTLEDPNAVVIQATVR